MLEVINMRGFVRGPDQKNHAPFTPFEVDGAWYARMARSNRHLLAIDEYRDKVRSIWPEPVLRSMAANRGLDDTLPLDALRDALCTFGDAPAPKEVVEEVAPAPAPAEEPTLDVDLGALEAAYSSDDFRAVQELLRPLGITGKARADLYPHAESLLGLED